ncbi:MAG: YicC/YloC family endoribonuclease [Planctomycetota bacterium]
MSQGSSAPSHSTTGDASVVYSMTGFGAGRVEAVLDDGTQLTVVCEVKTVNHKHLQAKLRLPHEYSSLEPAIDKRVRARLARGAVQMSIDVARIGGEAGVQLDERAARRYLDLQSALQDGLGDQGDALRPIDSMADLLRLPGVLVTGGAATGSLDQKGPEAQAVMGAVDDALDHLTEMRRLEGGAMLRDLAVSGEEITRLVDEIAEKIPGVVTHHRERLIERVGELSQNPATTEADLAREIALLSDRLDVSEEITRLQSHIDQLNGLLAGGGAVGRKLDFLAQEFFREANTIGSKCSDAEVAHLVVDLKTHVERLREQVQNVE